MIKEAYNLGVQEAFEKLGSTAYKRWLLKNNPAYRLMNHVDKARLHNDFIRRVDPKDFEYGVPKLTIDQKITGKKFLKNGRLIYIEDLGAGNGDNWPSRRVIAARDHNGHVIGSVDFNKGLDSRDPLKPGTVTVNPDSRRQGVASAMYDYVESEGARIGKADKHTSDGINFWNSRANKKLTRV